MHLNIIILILCTISKYRDYRYNIYQVFKFSNHLLFSRYNIYLSLFSDCINFWVIYMPFWSYLRRYHIQFLDYNHFAYSVIYLCIYVLRLDQIKPLCVSYRRSFSMHCMWIGAAYLLGDMIGVVFFLHSCNVHMYMRMYVTHHMRMYIR